MRGTALCAAQNRFLRCAPGDFCCGNPNEGAGGQPRLAEPSQSKPDGFASSPEGGALSVLTGRWQKAPPSGELASSKARCLRGLVLPGKLARRFSLWGKLQKLISVKAFCSRIVSALPAHPLARMLPIGSHRPQIPPILTTPSRENAIADDPQAVCYC